MDIIKVFGANLRKYRTKKGLSQEQFLKSADYIERTSVILNAFSEMFPSKTSKE